MVRQRQGPHLNGRWEHGASEARVVVWDQLRGRLNQTQRDAQRVKRTALDTVPGRLTVSARVAAVGFLGATQHRRGRSLSGSILQQLQRDQALAAAPDKSRFRSLGDAVQRLLSFHVCQGSVPTDEDLKRGEQAGAAGSRLSIAHLPSSQLTWLARPRWELTYFSQHSLKGDPNVWTFYGQVWGQWMQNTVGTLAAGGAALGSVLCTVIQAQSLHLGWVHTYPELLASPLWRYCSPPKAFRFQRQSKARLHIQKLAKRLEVMSSYPTSSSARSDAWPCCLSQPCCPVLLSFPPPFPAWTPLGPLHCLNQSPSCLQTCPSSQGL